MISGWHSLLLAASPLCVLGAGMIPSRWANRHALWMRCGAISLLAMTFCSALSASILLVWYGPLDIIWLETSSPLPLTVGVYFDNLGAVMLLLISFIGLIITCYSSRYLAGEPTQGRFLKWVLFTIGAVLLLVISRNLAMLLVTWILTSFGLHQLLTHYPDRPWALWAARKKFLISRLGDVALLAAVVLTFYCFGSLDYPDIFAAARMTEQNSTTSTWLLSLTALFFVLGAMTQTAQVPFHTWLPDTMETPTPVSALMHAGIINAGGFLLIRLSPLISLSPFALAFLAIVGAFTALLGAIIMLTQNSIKRSLAYSTMAQMGFMMLQCGLGAFSAALLHIVAHSVYKAHAFLSSGSVLDAAARLKTDFRPFPTRLHPLVTLSIAVGTALMLCLGTIWLLDIPFRTKPGAAVLGLILTIALTHLLWGTMTAGSWQLAFQGLLAATIVAVGYFTAYQFMEHLIAPSIPHSTRTTSWLDAVILGFVCSGFFGLFFLQAVTSSLAHRRSLQTLYVHAANGFYFDIPARRLTARVWGFHTPTP